jgi:hypothetical protein
MASHVVLKYSCRSTKAMIATPSHLSDIIRILQHEHTCNETRIRYAEVGLSSHSNCMHAAD